MAGRDADQKNDGSLFHQAIVIVHAYILQLLPEVFAKFLLLLGICRRVSKWSHVG
jgi:hypothetical protein